MNFSRNTEFPDPRRNPGGMGAPPYSQLYFSGRRVRRAGDAKIMLRALVDLRSQGGDVK